MSKVQVTPYNSEWSKQYEKAASEIKDKLKKHLMNIYHVGSTAVPGLASKPKIDIIAEVDDLAFDNKLLTDLGYEYRGGYSIPLRKSFTIRSKDLKVNLHVFEKDDPYIELNLLFRDYLRNNDQIRDDYAKLKYALLAEESSHQKNGMMYRGYTLGKNEFIQKVLRDVNFDRLRIVFCAHYNEWEAAKAFGGDLNQEDSHFMLYKGVDIIGYACVEIQGKKAVVKKIALEESGDKDKYEKEFNRLIDKWIKLMGYARA